MTKSPDTSQVLFRREYEHELETWLRRRFGYLCITYVVVSLLDSIFSAFFIPALSPIDSDGGSVIAGTFLAVGASLVQLVVVGRFYLRRTQLSGREEITQAASMMILTLGAISLGGYFLAQWLAPESTGSVVRAFFYWHLTACLFLPWTPGESLRPLLPLLVVWAGYTLLLQTGDFWMRLLLVIFSPGILIPGFVISSWRLRRHSRRFRSTMLGRHFRTLRQEFTKARGIHEAIFPAEYDDGYVKFQYTYLPMRELGGDFLHLHIGAEGLVHLALIDVTGHGLAAALTVNRIYGEMERIRAETPRAQPSDVIQLLNRYINLTMARHNIYATAIALQLDPYSGEIRWSSAGHPPAFLRGVNGVVRQLPATTVVLGALAPEEFEADEKSMTLSPGDVVVAYTDGAFEARDRMGSQLGLDNLRDVLRSQPSPQNWPQFICSYVDKHKAGRAEDDVLVTSLTFLTTRLQTKSAEAVVARS